MQFEHKFPHIMLANINFGLLTIDISNDKVLHFIKISKRDLDN